MPLPDGHGVRIQHVARRAVDWFRGLAEPITTLAEARQSVQMILGAYQSAESGQRVKLPLD